MGAPRLKNRNLPRYRFSDKDKEIIRFINAREARIMSTVIIDISETGVGFLTALKNAPRIGEIIKMDFSPLGSMRMACQGKVIHMETPPPNSGWSRYPGTVKVGVEFYDMPLGHRQMLHNILKEAFAKAGRDVRVYEEAQAGKTYKAPNWLLQNIWSVLATIGILGATGYGIYYYANLEPSEVSRPEPGWATQFFERTIRK
jgi:hypothetical protein